jgi:hypothetical protein
MSSLKRQQMRAQQRRGNAHGADARRGVSSLLDEMKNGNEYGSIVNLSVSSADLVPELQRGLAEIEAVRQRPCICYAANVVRQGARDTAITSGDHLPFNEMVDLVAAEHKGVDVLLVTPGGSAEQVALFVEALRKRFTSVEFLLPYKSMSAGTLWALSGDRIWMDERAFLGPIDPQVAGKDGRFVPAQSLLTLLNKFQQEGQAAIAKGQQPDWTQILILKELDYRQLGHAINASQYSITMATEYLSRYKFQSWQTHKSSGIPVTPGERTAAAVAAATALCSHDRWKNHGHAITRAIIESELRLVIDKPEDVPGLQRALRRTWALLYYVFDRSGATKIVLSGKYRFIRAETASEPRATP